MRPTPGFLLAVCQRFGAWRGVGIDLSTEACEEDVKAVQAAGLTDRADVEGDAFDVGPDAVAGRDAVVHVLPAARISSVSRAALVGFLPSVRPNPGRRAPADGGGSCRRRGDGDTATF